MRPSSSSSSSAENSGSPSTSPAPWGCSSSTHAANPNKFQCNVYRLLARREVGPRTKHNSKKFWAEAATHVDSHGTKSDSGTDARRGLNSWVESDSLQHLMADYCSLTPPPRSTIAAAFSPDGKTVASTHGDHTVKIIDCQTGRCLKVLRGHRRTPWVVRFHPLYPDLLASGSLDHDVRLWNANTGECIGSRDFYGPIASLAFHAQGELLAVASDKKVYIWHCNKRSTIIVFETWRSLRAVHFHPQAAPFLLTAEVNDLDSSDSSMLLATSAGYVFYPPPILYLADAHSGSVTEVQSEVNTSLLAAPSTELPCTVKLRICSHDVKDPWAPLDTEQCLLTIPHAVLSSEMGAHFSPCGRYLAACVACVLPNIEIDSGQVHHDTTEVATSPTRHPISAHKVIYELRVYSLEKATFGSVLASRAIRAAHCLTSVQFSPTSEHLLLAYGRRHCSLLKSVVTDGELTVPIYTILEVYRVSDMELVRALSSAEDEVNVACFHPSAGCGLVYGTRQGRLRILRYDRAHAFWV